MIKFYRHFTSSLSKCSSVPCRKETVESQSSEIKIDVSSWAKESNWNLLKHFTNPIDGCLFHFQSGQMSFPLNSRVFLDAKIQKFGWLSVVVLMFSFFIQQSVVLGQVTASITINSASIGGSGVMGASNYNAGAERTWTQSTIGFGGKAITCNPAGTPVSSTSCQFIQSQANNGVIYNTSALPGRLVSVQFTGSASVASSCFGGTSRLVNSTAANYTVGGTQIGTAQTNTTFTWTTSASDNYTFFCIRRGATTQYFSSVVITYELPPSISQPSAITGLNYVVGSGPSAWQLYTFTGTNLTPASGNLTITGAGNFEVSSDGINPASGNAYTVAYTGGALASTTTYVRLVSSLGSGNYGPTTGVTLSGGGATTINVSTAGTVSTASTISQPSAITGLNYVSGSGPSAWQSYTFSGSSLSPAAGDITVTGSTNFEVSSDGINPASGNTYLVPYTGSSLSSTTTWVRLKSGLSVATYGPVNGVTLSGGGATTINVSTTGSVTPLPNITITSPAIAAAFLGAPTSKNVIQNFTLAVATTASTLNSLTVTTAGSYNTTDLVPNSFKLWYNSTSNSIANATQIGTSQAVVSSGGSIIFSGLTQNLPVGNNYLFVTVDVASAASIGARNINITSTAFSNIVFASGNKVGTDPAVASGIQTFAAQPTISDVIVPQFIQGNTANRMPYGFRVTIGNLAPVANYRYIIGAVELAATDGNSSNGAGIGIFPDATSFVRASSQSLGTASQYGTFTTDGSGNYTGWFAVEPSGNARFTPGNTVNLRITLNDGASGTVPVTRVTTTLTAKVIDFGTTSLSATQGTGLRGLSNAPARNFVFVYDNTSGLGTSQPISGTWVESDGTVNTTGNSYASFYSTSVEATNGAYGVIIPNLLANGIRRLEQRSFSTGSVIGCPATDADGVWTTAGSTVNPVGGSTPIVFGVIEAPLTCPTVNLNTGGFGNAFGNVEINTNSSVTSFTLDGNTLSGPISLTPPSGLEFEISSTNSPFTPADPITFSPVSGNVTTKTIYVRFSPTSLGLQSGNITVASTGVTTQTIAVTGTGVAPLPASELAITAISPVSPVQDAGFSVTVRSVDNTNTPRNVTVDTDFSITLATGSGSLGGTLTGTILAGTSQVVVTGLTYSIPATNVSLTATRTAGALLTPGTSSVFTVLGVATQLVFVNTPTCPGGSETNFTSFSVEARRADNSVDVNYSGAIVITIKTGTGSVTGTVSLVPTLGVATFTLVAPTLGGIKTLAANSSVLTEGVSGSISVVQNPSLTEVILPQFISGTANKLPYASRLTVSFLTPNTTYRYYNTVVLDATDGATGTGAGTVVYVNGGTFSSTSSVSLTTAGGYGTFTTDVNGSYTGWFINESTGNARFTAGNAVRIRLQIDGGNNGILTTRLTTSSTISAINLTGTISGATAVRGTSLANAKNFVFTYANTAGTGRPTTGTFVESEGTNVSYPTFYSSNVQGVSGSWGTFVPNNSSIRRIEQRDLTSGAIVGCAPTDTDGAWPSGANTVGASGGTTALVIPVGDAPLVNPTFTSASIAGTYTCEGSQATINLTGLFPGASHTIGYMIGSDPYTKSAVLADGSGNASFTTGNLTVAENGQVLTIMSVQIGVSTCSISPAFNSGIFDVRPRPTVDISAKDYICQGQKAEVNFFFTGSPNWNFQYTLNGGAAISVNNQSTSPFTFQSPTAGTTNFDYVVTNLSDANCSATPGDLDNLTIVVPLPDCFVTWDGSSNNDWNIASNWNNNSVPSLYTSVIIPAGITNIPDISGSTANCADLSISSNTTLGIGGVLNVKGDIAGNGSVISGVGKLVLNGTGIQTITGNLKISNVDLNNSSTQGIVVSTGSKFKIEPTSASGSGLVTFLPSNKLTVNGDFILGSNLFGTAKIGLIPTSASILPVGAQFIQERYLPYTTGIGSWYFIGSPFSGKNFTDLADDFRVTGLSSGFGSQGGDIISSAEPERSTIFKYVEATHDQRIDTVQKIGWTIPGSTDQIVAGNGYRVFVNYASNASHKFDSKGTLNRNDFNFPTLTRNELGACIPTTFPCNEISNRGWNLIANPYPCDIDWDVAAGWTKPVRMSNAWYRWNSAGNGYGVYSSGVYAGATPAPSNPNVIPSGQAYFVRLATAGTYNEVLTVKELAKTTSTSGQFVRVNTISDLIRVHIAKANSSDDYGYDAVIRFLDNATDGVDLNSDFSNMAGSKFQITVPVNGEEMAIASYAPVSDYKSIQLAIDYKGATGEFALSFADLESLLETNQVFLKDNFLDQLFSVTSGSSYGYSVANDGSASRDRFEILINPYGLTSVSSILSGAQVLIHPNPSASGTSAVLNIRGFDDSSVNIYVTDAVGRQVYATTASLTSINGTNVNLSKSLPAGVYTVTTSGARKTVSQKFVVK